MGARRGYVLIALSLSIFFLLGMVGLAVDLGRMYVVKNESQSFCDSAAMFAANKLLDFKNLPNPADRIHAAEAAVTWVAQDPNGPQKRFEFGTREFQNITTTFAKSWDAPESDWVSGTAAAIAADAHEYVFVRVRTTNPVNLWFLPVLVNRTASNVASSAVAGASAESQMVQGLAPFAPFQLPDPGEICTEEELAGCKRDDADPFGMMKGEWYTLRWLAGNLDLEKDLPNFCPGDQCPCMLKLANLSGAQSAGYAMYHGASDIRQAIIGTPPLSEPITEGSILNLENGQIAAEMNALHDRVMQDTDYTSNHYLATYPAYPFQEASPDAYSGKGRRIMVVPIQSAAGAATATKTNTVVGFAGFYLGPGVPQTYKSGHMSTVGACAQYLGQFTIGVPGSGGEGPGSGTVYTLRLYR